MKSMRVDDPMESIEIHETSMEIIKDKLKDHVQDIKGYIKR